MIEPSLLRQRQARTPVVLVVFLLSLGWGAWGQKPASPPQRRDEAHAPDKDNPRERQLWELERFGDPSLYAGRLLREQERQRALYPAQVPRGRVGEVRPLAPFSGPTWLSLGPTNAGFETNGITLNVVDSGRLQSILPHPTDANTVYVLGSGGGLWKTTNFLSNPPTWVPLTDSLLTTGGGSAIFGSTPSIIYLGLGDPFDNSPLAGGAMTKSTDGGSTWATPIKVDNCCRVSASVRDVKVDIGAGTSSQDVVLAATDVGMSRSVDGGTTYTPVADATTFFALEFWSIVKTSAGWLASSEDDNNGQNGAIWVSTDHGATWSAIPNSGSVISGVRRITLGVGAPGDSVVYAFAENGPGLADDQQDLYRSTDGGLNWTALGLAGKTPKNPNADQPDMDLMHDQAFYNQLLLIDPTDATRNTVYIGGNLCSAKSTDGGATWTVITDWLPGGVDPNTASLPYAHADFHTAAFSNISGTKTLFFGNDGGLFVSADGGTTWNDKKNIGLVTELHYSVTSNPTSPDSTITGLQDLGTRVRETNTSVFDQTIGGDGFGTGTGQVNALITLGSYVFDTISSSDDLGVDPTHWISANSGINTADSGFFTEITTPASTADATGKVFFTTGLHDVYKTTNGGASWSSIGHSGTGGISSTTSIRNVVHAVGVSPVDTNHVALAGSGGILPLTTNGGTSWTEVNLGTAVANWGLSNVNIAYASNSILYVCSESPNAGKVRVARSGDGGSTWQAANTGLPDVQVSRVVIDPSDATGNTVYAGTFIGVYRTTNGGTSWSLFGGGLPQVHVTDMYIPPDGSKLRISTFGRGIWEIPLKATAAPTTTVLASSANPSVFGQPVTLTATVNSTSATGTVTFLDGATNIGTKTLSSGVATLIVSNLTLGGHSLTASYGGDANFQPSVSTTLTQTVNQAATTTALGSSANPAVFGQSVTFMATVTATAPGAGTPTGTITFRDGATSLGTAPLSGGVATLMDAALAVGSHSITASYSADTNFTASTSSALPQVINKDATVVAEGSSAPNPSVFGQPVTFSATVSAAAPGAGTPTGTVSFKEGAATLAQGTLSAGSASAMDSSLAVGVHSVVANYGGDGNFNSAVSTAVSQTVNKANTTTALVSSVNPSTASQLVTFTATVTAAAPGAGTPTGTVTFFNGANNIGVGTLSGGVATLATSTLPVGADSISAVYGADGNFSASTSNIVSQVVNSATGPTADLSIAPIQQTPTHPVAFGGMLTETIVVSNAGPNNTTTTTLTVDLTGKFLVKSLSSGCSGTNTITCNLGPLASGASGQVTITLTPLLGRTISIQVNVSSDLPDNSPTNNAASDQIKVVPRPQAR